MIQKQHEVYSADIRRQSLYSMLTPYQRKRMHMAVRKLFNGDKHWVNVDGVSDRVMDVYAVLFRSSGIEATRYVSDTYIASERNQGVHLRLSEDQILHKLMERAGQDHD